MSATDKYYRIAEKGRDQTKDTSMHVPLSLDDLLMNEIGYEKYIDLEMEDMTDAEKIEILHDEVDRHFFYQSEAEGHEGEGLYCDGVCVLDSPEAVIEYMESRGGIAPDSALCQLPRPEETGLV